MLISFGYGLGVVVFSCIDLGLHPSNSEFEVPLVDYTRSVLRTLEQVNVSDLDYDW
jgi:hypothetical protein